MKYIEVRHLDFWWVHYGFEGMPEKTVEVNITEDKDGKIPFLGLDIGTAQNLLNYIEDESEECLNMINSENHEDIFMRDYYKKTLASCEKMREYYEKLISGEIYCFVLSVLFKDYSPDLDTCNSLRGSGRSILSLKTERQPPFFADIYLNEKFINSTDSLIACLKRVFVELKLGDDEEFIFRNAFTKEEAQNEIY